MKIKVNTINKLYAREHTHEISLPGYWATEQVIEDLDRVLEYHKLKYEKYKASYIKAWGDKAWAELEARAGDRGYDRKDSTLNQDMPEYK